jgi:hypothetical protein
MGALLSNCLMSREESIRDSMSTSDFEWHRQTPLQSHFPNIEVMGRLDRAYQNALYQTKRPSVSVIFGSRKTSQSPSLVRVSFASESTSVKLIEHSDGELSFSGSSDIYTTTSAENRLRVNTRWVTYAQHSPCTSSKGISAPSVSYRRPSQSQSCRSQLTEPWAPAFL